MLIFKLILDSLLCLEEVVVSEFVEINFAYRLIFSHQAQLTDLLGHDLGMVVEEEVGMVHYFTQTADNFK